MNDVVVRPGKEADFPAVTALYNRFVLESPATFDVAPFTVEERLEWFGQFASAGGRYRLFVAERDGAFAGYAASVRHKVKPAYETSVETTIYVAPEFTGLGIGRALYEALFASLKGEDVHMALCGVVLPNEASLRLHRSFGFTEIGVFREVGRKFGRFHDVMWFEKRL